MTDCIVENLKNTDSWQQKKVKKTNLIVGLWPKAAKECPNEELKAKCGAKLLKEIEAAAKSDKSLGNLKSRVKQIKQLIN